MAIGFSRADERKFFASWNVIDNLISLTAQATGRDGDQEFVVELMPIDGIIDENYAEIAHDALSKLHSSNQIKCELVKHDSLGREHEQPISKLTIGGTQELSEGQRNLIEEFIKFLSPPYNQSPPQPSPDSIANEMT